MSVHWLVLPVDPEGEPFIAWGSVEADEYRRQPAVYRVEEYVPAEQLAGAVEALRAIVDYRSQPARRAAETEREQMRVIASDALAALKAAGHV